jgi:hypothetical protein
VSFFPQSSRSQCGTAIDIESFPSPFDFAVISEFVLENKINGPSAAEEDALPWFISATWTEMEVVDTIDDRSEHYLNRRSIEYDFQETDWRHLEQHREDDEFSIKHQGTKE